MEEIRTLLNRRWVRKKEDPDLYFTLKDRYLTYRDFFREKLGYSVIINPLLIKVEKVPGKSHPWMGIDTFDSPFCYVLLCYTLMFLETLEPEEQFVLSQVTDYLRGNTAQEESPEPLDWTQYSQRRALIKVLHFLQEEGMILTSDGDDSLFAASEASQEVLYENTGTSKYFLRRFPFDITPLKTLEDFQQLEWQGSEADRGLIRRHRVYRRLVMEPVVYQESDDDPDFLYIKNQRSVIQNDLEKHLQASLHLHKNTAMVLFPEQSSLKDSFPNRKNLSDIILQLGSEVRRQLADSTLTPNQRDEIHLSRGQWEDLLMAITTRYAGGWSKAYREATQRQLSTEVLAMMTGFGMATTGHLKEEVILLPALGKMTGEYPADYLPPTATEPNTEPATAEAGETEETPPSGKAAQA